MKDEFAEGFLVTLILRESGGLGRVLERFAEEDIPVQLKSCFDRKAVVGVAKQDFGRVLRLIRTMRQPDSECHGLIDDWGFSSYSLERVFEKLNEPTD